MEIIRTKYNELLGQMMAGHQIINGVAIIILIVWSQFTRAQTVITLQQAIVLAQQSSLQVSLNKNNLEIAEQTYKLQRAQLFPQVNLNA
ncbi:MAG TPA: hypothetical protein DIU05_10755, partial [Bacteroidetes bacterium]|nr:hypothetical protein [Bacteroidota bacterium]